MSLIKDILKNYDQTGRYVNIAESTKAVEGESTIHSIPGIGETDDVGLTLLKKRDPKAYEKMMNWD